MGAQALRGELLLARGETGTDLALLREPFGPLREEQQDVVLTATLRAYAEGLARIGRIEEALGTISARVDHAALVSPTYLLPELIRTQADIMLAIGREDGLVAACYQKAIACGQQHEAPSWECWAATSLARFRIAWNRRREALVLLEGALSRFTEGQGRCDQLRQECLGSQTVAPAGPLRAHR
ncbi:hypothetical protein [Inquilinus limosus]|uniref:Bacterial transcriptional activator domain-containing protein n=1 Tax=Inquilinus limosus TaxID=171674 RepID=A0A211ZV12_9PROT|nr:hypothetical protein [Inquilinus limosus]OWJ69054.1 hypothetical protein BWR60_00455 [Inquilinus limosus]